MLVLTRNVGEPIVIADHTYIQVTRIQDRNVRLSIDAPKDIEIHYEEPNNQVQQNPFYLNPIDLLRMTKKPKLGLFWRTTRERCGSLPTRRSSLTAYASC